MMIFRSLAKMPEVTVLPHPPHSPDIAPSDYGLFRGMQCKLKDHHFNNREEVYEWLDNFFAKRPDGYYFNLIKDLERRWDLILQKYGQYFEN